MEAIGRMEAGTIAHSYVGSGIRQKKKTQNPLMILVHRDAIYKRAQKQDTQANIKTQGNIH